jgi:hypothetical protein
MPFHRRLFGMSRLIDNAECRLCLPHLNHYGGVFNALASGAGHGSCNTNTEFLK